jgi:hypothetical protein
MTEDNGNAIETPTAEEPAEAPSTITITFAGPDSISHKVDAYRIHPNQFIVAAEILRVLGVEYFENARMTEAINAEQRRARSAADALVISRGIIAERGN